MNLEHSTIRTVEEIHPVKSRFKTVLPFILGLFLICAAAAGGYLLRMRTHPQLKVQVVAAPLPGSISATTTVMPGQKVVELEKNIPTENKPKSNLPILRENTAQIPLPQTLGKNIYTNSDMNLSMQIPSDWQVDPGQSNEKRLVFTSDALGETAYIERYEGVTASLENIETTLQNSPSVIKTQKVLVLGKPAIAFTGSNGSPDGVAMLNNNSLYYFHAQTATDAFLQNMTFIN